MKNSNSKYKQIYKIVNGDEITIFFYNENISSIDEFFITEYIPLVNFSKDIDKVFYISPSIFIEPYFISKN